MPRLQRDRVQRDLISFFLLTHVLVVTMRLWSLHPRYLDWKGLGADWREGLLGQAIILGKTKGWRNHPQMNRFKAHQDPVAAISYYLQEVHLEAIKRGYNYN